MSHDKNYADTSSWRELLREDVQLCEKEPEKCSRSLLTASVLALKASAPIAVGYVVMGLTWGMLARGAEFSLLNTILAAVVVFSGSLQFLLLGMLAAASGVAEILLSAALLNSRYFFYVLSAKKQFDALNPAARCLAAIAVNDESFAVISAKKFCPRVMLLICLFSYSYWIIACAAGWLLALAISGDYSSLGFSSTALFIALACDLIAKNSSSYALVIAVGAMLFATCMLPSNFMLLGAVCIALVALWAGYKRGLL